MSANGRAYVCYDPVARDHVEYYVNEIWEGLGLELTYEQLTRLKSYVAECMGSSINVYHERVESKQAVFGG